MQISNQKLCQTGFKFTPIGATLDDSMKWFSMNMDADIKFGTVDYDLGLERSRGLELIEQLRF